MNRGYLPGHTLDTTLSPEPSGGFTVEAQARLPIPDWATLVTVSRGAGTIKRLSNRAATSSLVFLFFTGAVTLVHDATYFILPGGANISAAAGDMATCVPLGDGKWRVVGYQSASALGGGGGLVIGTNVQAWDADLDTLAALGNWKTPYTDGSGNIVALAVGAAGTVFAGNGTSAAPSWQSALTLSTSLTSPLIIGGTGASSTLTLESTSGAGTTDKIIFKAGSQVTYGTLLGATGFWGLGLETNPQARLVVSDNTATGINPFGGQTYQLVGIGSDSGGAGLALYGPNASGGVGFHFYQSKGTAPAPLRTKSGNTLGAFGGRGAYAADDVTTASFVTTSKVNTVYGASEDWTSTAQGCYQSWYTTATGTIIRSEVMRLQPSGGLSVGAGSTTTDHGNGSIVMGGTLTRVAPVIETAATHTLAATTTHLICNRAGTITVTLPAAASFPGKEIYIRTITANAVVSASSNVVPLAGGAAGTAILAATAGKWAFLVSDGANWQITAGA